jgi:uncharacterized protein (TIRG00374 family)
MLYTGLFGSLVIIFLLAEILTLVVYPNAQAPSLVGYLKYLPVIGTVVILTAIVFLLMTKVGRLRSWLRRFAYEKLGSRTLSPVGIIRARKLDRNTVLVMAFASFAVWLIEAFTMWLCMRSVGLDIPPLIAVFGFAFAKVFTYLPLVPGGIGEVEAATGLFFAAYGFPVLPVLTGTVLYRLITYWAPLILGMAAFVLLRKGSAASSLALGLPVFSARLHRR